MSHLVNLDRDFDFYVLDELGEPRLAGAVEWIAWLTAADANGSRIVEITHLDDGWRVSTIFLGFPKLSIIQAKPRQMFETVIFCGRFSHLSMHYATRAEALVGHQIALNMALHLMSEHHVQPLTDSPRLETR